MVGANQGIPQSFSFSGICFFLSGYNPNLHDQVKSKLVGVGAVHCGNYGPDSTHVIVHDLVFDHPICVTARKDGKTLITSLWVDHSLDAGEPVDATSIMYRPPKDLNGIPVAKELVMCLTGYRRQDREDIMVMVRLMGAQFSKPLVANKVTHLICYKFEGEKYELAKRTKKIKLINHLWLEDCLRAWKILPEENYRKSDYELEIMEAEAKDSEEEMGDAPGQFTRDRSTDAVAHQSEKGKAQHHSPLSSKMSRPSTQQGLSNNVNCKNLQSLINKEINCHHESRIASPSMMNQQLPWQNRQHNEIDTKLDNVYDESVRFPSYDQNGNQLPPASSDAGVSSLSGASKFSGLIYSRKTPARKSSTMSHFVKEIGKSSQANSKTRKLSTSGSKRIDAAELTTTPTSLPLEQNKNLGCRHTGDDIVKTSFADDMSPNVSSNTLQLDKLVGPNEIQKETKPVADDDPGESKYRKQVGKLVGKKRHAILLLNKFENSVDIERENECFIEGSKANVKDSRKLGSKCNLNHGPVEPKNDDIAVETDQSTTKGGKLASKLAGKKRRGSLKDKSKAVAEVETENESVQGDDERYGRKVAAKSKQNQWPVKRDKENDPIVDNNQGTDNAGKLPIKKRRCLALSNSEESVDKEKEKVTFLDDVSSVERRTEKSFAKPKLTARESGEKGVNTNIAPLEAARFLLSGHKLQKKEFQNLIKHLKGKLCKDSHHWSYQATHLIMPDPIRRTEKFFAATASGRWILKTDYLTASSHAGNFLAEEPYEWHNTGLTEDGAISLEAPRKWRLVREKTGHGAFYGLRIIIYGECIAPPLDTLKRVVKAGDGIILATSPPYTKFLKSGVDFAIVSPGIARVDIWVQELLRHEIPCVSADYLVEYVCKPGYSLDRHVQYNTHEWAAKNLLNVSFYPN